MPRVTSNCQSLANIIRVVTPVGLEQASLLACRLIAGEVLVTGGTLGAFTAPSHEELQSLLANTSSIPPLDNNRKILKPFQIRCM